MISVAPQRGFAIEASVNGAAVQAGCGASHPASAATISSGPPSRSRMLRTVTSSWRPASASAASM